MDLWRRERHVVNFDLPSWTGNGVVSAAIKTYTLLPNRVYVFERTSVDLCKRTTSIGLFGQETKGNQISIPQRQSCNITAIGATQQCSL